MLRKLVRFALAIIRLLIHFLFSFSNEQILTSKSSKYNKSVLICSSGSKIKMRFNNLSSGVQSEIDLKQIDHPNVEYIQLMLISLIYYPLDLNDRNKHILIVGLGGGVLPRALRNLYPNCTIKIIEIDDIVYELAKTYFYFQEDSNMNVEICDGRYYLNRISNDIYYDIIFIDAYDSNNSLPFHMKTEEFFILLKTHLNINGSLIIFNLIPLYKSYLNISQTIFSVFGYENLIEFRTKNFLNMIVVISTFSNKIFSINIHEKQTFIRMFEDKLSINVIHLLKTKENLINSFDSTIEIYRDQSKQIFYEETLSLKQFINL